MGIANGDIPDSNIQASHGSSKGRLNGSPFHSIVTGKPWVEADIGYRTCVSGVVTQGDGHSGTAADWVTLFLVSTSQCSNTTQVFVKENGQAKVSWIRFSCFFCCFVLSIIGVEENY